MSTRAEDIVAKTGELPAFPHVAAKVMKMVSDPKTSAKSLQEVIITDQGMTARILKISNSAMFGLKREVRTLTHAITLLGFNTIRSIVIAAAAKNIYNKKNTTGDLERQIWKTALGCALIARFLAERLIDQNINKEEAFIGGLMHNVGKTLLITSMHDIYAGLIQQAREENQPIEQLERETLGFDHCDIGNILLKKWNLSDNLTEAVRCYNAPVKASSDCQKLTATIGLAHQYCRDFGLGLSRVVSLEDTDLNPHLSILNLGFQQILAWREEIKLRVETDMEMFQTI